LLNTPHLGHDLLVHVFIKVLPKSLKISIQLILELLLHVLKTQVVLLSHLICQTIDLRTHALLHTCKIWVKVTSWRHPLWLHRWWRRLHCLLMASPIFPSSTSLSLASPLTTGNGVNSR